MPLIAKDKKGDFTVPPEGLFQSVCVDVVDLGMKSTAWGEKHMIQIRFQLEDVDPKSGKPLMVSRQFGLSLSEKSHLRPFLESWRGKKFTAEELEGFDLERLIGVNAQVQLIHNLGKNGSTFANIQAIVKHAGPNKLEARDYIRAVDRDQNNGDEHYHADDSDVPF